MSARPDAGAVAARNAEATEMRWVPADRIHELPLHPGLAASWDTVSTIA